MISNHSVDITRIISIYKTISAKTALTTSHGLPFPESLALTQHGDARGHRNSLSHCCGTNEVLVLIKLGHKRAPDPTEDRTWIKLSA